MPQRGAGLSVLTIDRTNAGDDIAHEAAPASLIDLHIVGIVGHLEIQGDVVLILFSSGSCQ